jgi:hypothetical protein
MSRYAVISLHYPYFQYFAKQNQSHDGREQNLLTAILNSPSVSNLKNNPTALLAAIDDFSLHEDFLISIGPHKAGVISKIIAENKPRVVVELGGYLGYSAILFAAAMKKEYGISLFLRLLLFPAHLPEAF